MRGDLLAWPEVQLASMFIGSLDSRGRFASVSQCHQIQLPSADHCLVASVSNIIAVGKTMLKGSVASVACRLIAVFAPVLPALIAAKTLEAWPDCVASCILAISNSTVCSDATVGRLKLPEGRSDATQEEEAANSSCT